MIPLVIAIVVAVGVASFAVRTHRGLRRLLTDTMRLREGTDDRLRRSLGGFRYFEGYVDGLVQRYFLRGSLSGLAQVAYAEPGPVRFVIIASAPLLHKAHHESPISDFPFSTAKRVQVADSQLQSLVRVYVVGGSTPRFLDPAADNDVCATIRTEIATLAAADKYFVLTDRSAYSHVVYWAKSAQARDAMVTSRLRQLASLAGAIRTVQDRAH